MNTVYIVLKRNATGVSTEVQSPSWLDNQQTSPCQTPKNLCHNLALLSRARVVKLVDAGDSKSPAARRAGSIPAPGTIGNPYRPDTIATPSPYE